MFNSCSGSDSFMQKKTAGDYCDLQLSMDLMMQVATSFMYIVEYRIWKLSWAYKDHKERRRLKKHSRSEALGSRHESIETKQSLLDDQQLKIKVTIEDENLTKGCTKGSALCACLRESVVDDSRFLH